MGVSVTSPDEFAYVAYAKDRWILKNYWIIMNVIRSIAICTVVQAEGDGMPSSNLANAFLLVQLVRTREAICFYVPRTVLEISSINPVL